MALPWPVAWSRPFPAGGSPVTGWVLRILGVAALVGIALGVLFAVVGATTLSQGSSDGWSDLAGAISLVLATSLLILGGLLSLGVHLGYTAWSEGRPSRRRIGVLSWCLVVSAACYLPFYLFVADAKPLDDYAAAILVAVGLAGIALLVAKDGPNAPMDP